MVDKTLAYLDFTRLLTIIRKYSSVPFCEENITAILPLGNEGAVAERLDRIEAILEVIRPSGRIPFSAIPDIRPQVKKSVIKGALLEPADFLAVADFLQACSGIRSFLRGAESRPPYVAEVIEGIEGLPELHGRIRKTINPEGFIEDTASYELSRIRSELFSFRERIRRNLERMMESETLRSVLQDDYISIRNGRYVIPLKPNFNQAIQGIVHDHSHSLKTSFVEPVAVVELNNAVNILDKEEKEEEKRILQELTAFIGSKAEILARNLQIISDLDFHHAVACFSDEFRCLRPRISGDGNLEIRGARNPFIILSKPGRAVPIDIVMKRETKVMIISGPNAGGKTAALKTLGLTCLMAAAGLFVPAQGEASIPAFPRIFAVVGDEQDISMELSSFSAHVSALRDLLNGVGEGDLVLVDEIGGGTEPQEASALAMAIMDGFVEKGCRLVVTTHLNLLKAYGYTNDFAMNVACAFDPETVQPLYRLLYNTAGYSNAVTLARSLNLPSSIIEKSERYLGTQEKMLAELVSSLEEQRSEFEKERRDLARLREEMKNRLSLLKAKREEYLEGFTHRLGERLRDVEEEIENIRKEVARREKSAINIARGKFHTLKTRQGIRGSVEQAVFASGDYVRVKTLGGTGRVTSADPRKDLYEVALGNATTRVTGRYLEKIKGDGRQPEPAVEIHVEKLEDRELDLLGMRVDDAVDALDRFIDKAVVEGLERVRVRHGVGTGRLMKAVRARLAESPQVKAVHDQERNAGITIVEFR
jgi:DNA mismatch repair protein MutS2